jgi:hypothetical protein
MLIFPTDAAVKMTQRHRQSIEHGLRLPQKPKTQIESTSTSLSAAYIDKEKAIPHISLFLLPRPLF